MTCMDENFTGHVLDYFQISTLYWLWSGEVTRSTQHFVLLDVLLNVFDITNFVLQQWNCHVWISDEDRKHSIYTILLVHTQSGVIIHVIFSSLILIYLFCRTSTVRFEDLRLNLYQSTPISSSFTWRNVTHLHDLHDQSRHNLLRMKTQHHSLHSGGNMASNTSHDRETVMRLNNRKSQVTRKQYIEAYLLWKNNR